MPGKPLDTPTWMGRPILHPDDSHELEANAAISEFHHKMPRREAEQKSHDDYVKRQREKAAAHHLRGMKASGASGDLDSARKHSALYTIHMRALGNSPTDPPPPGIAYMANSPTEPLHRFKAHKGDLFALGGHEQKDETAEKSEVDERLEVLAKAARLLAAFKSVEGDQVG